MMRGVRVRVKTEIEELLEQIAEQEGVSVPLLRNYAILLGLYAISVADKKPKITWSRFRRLYRKVSRLATAKTQAKS